MLKSVPMIFVWPNLFEIVSHAISKVGLKKPQRSLSISKLRWHQWLLWKCIKGPSFIGAYDLTAALAMYSYWHSLHSFLGAFLEWKALAAYAVLQCKIGVLCSNCRQWGCIHVFFFFLKTSPQLLSKIGSAIILSFKVNDTVWAQSVICSKSSNRSGRAGIRAPGSVAPMPALFATSREKQSKTNVSNNPGSWWNPFAVAWGFLAIPDPLPLAAG